MVQLDDFKRFNFQHLTSAEFFEVQGLIAQLLRERNAYYVVAYGLTCVKEVDKAVKKILKVE